QAVRDSERGINRVQIGHRIGDRKHVIEREMNVGTGQISENVELENLDEDETDNFKKEWRQKSAQAGFFRHSHHPYHSNAAHQITSHRLHQPSVSSQLAIEHGASARSHNRQTQRPSKQYRAPLHQSDTIDLTEDTPVEDDIQEIHPSQIKRKASATFSSSPSVNMNNHHKHRQTRF
ncbi:unnamed protein product, partial [Adineta ricciae]